MKYAAHGDPNYLDPAYHPILAPGETWFEARTKQVEAIKTAEAKTQAAAQADAARKKTFREARRAHA